MTVNSGLKLHQTVHHVARSKEDASSRPKCNDPLTVNETHKRIYSMPSSRSKRKERTESDLI
jgi:hypothetical protein